MSMHRNTVLPFYDDNNTEHREVLDMLSQSFEAETVRMAAVLRDWASSSNLMGM